MSDESRVLARVHRFCDTVAIYVDQGETVYLTVKQARSLSAAINKISRSIERETFAKSSGLTKGITT